MTQAAELNITLDLGLSEQEIFLIGGITSQWGAMEHEIFVQCLLTFDCDEGEEIVLPKEMKFTIHNNV